MEEAAVFDRDSAELFLCLNGHANRLQSQIVLKDGLLKTDTLQRKGGPLALGFARTAELFSMFALRDTPMGFSHFGGCLQSKLPL
jgi:hypothetical protein